MSVQAVAANFHIFDLCVCCDRSVKVFIISLLTCAVQSSGLDWKPWGAHFTHSQQILQVSAKGVGHVGWRQSPFEESSVACNTRYTVLLLTG